MEYYGMDPGTNGRFSKITKWGVVVVCAYLGVYGAMAGRWFYIPFALVLIVFSFFRKEYVLSSGGFDTRRVFLFYKTHNVWSWDEVTHIIVDYEMMKPAAMILIARGKQRRQFSMRAEDAEAAVKLARKKNPDIILETQDASGRHKAYNYNRGTGAKNQDKVKNGADKKPPLVEQPESFADVKEELAKKKQREEQLAQYRRPDIRTANIGRPDKALKGFR